MRSGATTNNPSAATKLSTADITTTSFNDTTASPDIAYYYFVKAKNTAGATVLSTPDFGLRSVVTLPLAPTSILAGRYPTGQIHITWSASTDAISYAVYRAATNDPSTAALVADNVANTFYDDTSAPTTGGVYYWLTAKNNAGSSPFSSTSPAPSIPTTIEVENFDNGPEGLAYHDTDTANVGGVNYRPGTGVDLETSGDPNGGGYVLGNTHAGEWLKYTVNVPVGGTYTLTARVASPAAGATFHLETETGFKVTAPVTIPNTGGWSNYTDVVVFGTTLPQGPHTLKLVMDTNATNGYAGNFNNLKFA